MRNIVWIVDDQEMMRFAIEAVIRGYLPGIDVVAFSSSPALLSAFETAPEESRPRLVVTDNRMPVMNGTELARELRKRKPDQRIIMVSGDDRLKCADVDKLLSKPFANAALAEAVRSFLR